MANCLFMYIAICLLLICSFVTCCGCAGYDYKGYSKGGLYRFEGATSK